MMTHLLSAFTDAAKNLSRNPLGIIALFIVLVYGIAALVFGFSGDQLEGAQRWPLIWFLVLFPVLVLLLFGWLVAQHHTKLYSPGDYPDKEGFFRALSPQEQRRRLEEEARVFSSADGNAAATSSPDVSKTQEALRRRISSDARFHCMMAEDLVFRELESEIGQTIQRNAAIAGADVGIDGLVVHRNRITAIEVKLTRESHWTDILRRAFSQVNRLIEHLPAGTAFIVAMVIDSQPDLERRAQTDSAFRFLEQYRNSDQVRQGRHAVDLRVYDFDELKKKYGLEGEA